MSGVWKATGAHIARACIVALPGSTLLRVTNIGTYYQGTKYTSHTVSPVVPQLDKRGGKTSGSWQLKGGLILSHWLQDLIPCIGSTPEMQLLD